MEFFNYVDQSPTAIPQFLHGGHNDVVTNLLGKFDVYFGAVPFRANGIQHPDLIGC